MIPTAPDGGDHRAGRIRRWLRLGLIAAGILILVSCAYAVTSMYWAVSGVRQDAAAATAAVQQGDLDGAAQDVSRLAKSSSDLASVGPSFAWNLASHLPFVGPSVTALNVMAGEVSTVAGAAEPVLASVAGATSTTERIAALGKSEADLRGLADQVAKADAAISTLDPSALYFGLAEQASALQKALPQALAVTTGAADAAEQLLPSLLGMDGRRTWLVLLQNPAEARGSGGLFSGYALVEVKDGKPTILQAETRKQTLDSLKIPYVDAVPPDVAALWGPALGMWASFNLSGNFPTVAKLATAGMAQAGTPVDGVVAVDAYAVQALLAGTGPVEHRGVTIDSTDAAAFFTKDLYAKFPDFPDVAAKDDLALGLTYATIDSLLKRPLDLGALITSIPPMIEAGHVKVWSPQADEETWLAKIGMAGDITDLNPATAVVTLNNSTGGKLDAYVSPELTYIVGICRVESGPSAGQRRSALQVTLHNDAPSGLPNYVDVRLDDPAAPAGSTRLQTYMYGPEGADLRDMYLDDQYPPVTIGSEADRPVWGTGVELLRGQTSTLTFIYDEPAESIPDPAVILPGSAVPATVTVKAVNSDQPCPTAAEDMPTREELAAIAAGS